MMNDMFKKAKYIFYLFNILSVHFFIIFLIIFKEYILF